MNLEIIIDYLALLPYPRSQQMRERAIVFYRKILDARYKPLTNSPEASWSVVVYKTHKHNPAIGRIVLMSFFSRGLYTELLADFKFSA